MALFDQSAFGRGGLFGSGGLQLVSTRPTRKKKGKKKERGGVLGFFENLVTDIRDTFLGIGPGIRDLFAVDRWIRGDFSSTINTFKGIGQAYAQMYGPLFKGDFDAFARNLYEHPLGPILDVAAVAAAPFTFGGSIAGRSAGLLSRVGAPAGVVRTLETFSRPRVRVFRSPAARTSGITITRETTRADGTIEPIRMEFTPTQLGQAIRRGDVSPLEVGDDVAIQLGSPGMRISESILDRIIQRSERLETRRFGKIKDREIQMDVARMTAHLRRFQNAYGRLNQHERAAFAFIGRGFAPNEYRRILATDRDGELTVEPATRKLLESEKSMAKIQAAFENPSRRLRAAIQEAKMLSDLDAKIKLKHGLITPEEALERPFLSLRVMSGARFFSEAEINRTVRQIDSQIKKLDDQIGRVESKIARVSEPVKPPRLTGSAVPAAERALRREQQEVERLTDPLKGRIARSQDRIDALRTYASGLERARQDVLDAQEAFNRIYEGNVRLSDYDELGVPIPQPRERTARDYQRYAAWEARTNRLRDRRNELREALANPALTGRARSQTQKQYNKAESAYQRALAEEPSMSPPPPRDMGEANLRLLTRAWDRLVHATKKLERMKAAHIGLQEEMAKLAGFEAELVSRKLRAAQAQVRVESAKARDVARLNKALRDLQDEQSRILKALRADLEALKGGRRELAMMREEWAKRSPGFYGGKSLETIRRELKEKKRIEPFYLPDHMVPRRITMGKTGKGAGPQDWRVHVNQKLAEKFGRIALNEDVLGPEFLNSVKNDMAISIHRVLKASARKLPVGEALPKGYVFLRKDRSEQISYAEKHRAEFDDSMRALLDDDTPTGGLTTTSSGEAAMEGTHRLIVRESLVKEMAGEFRKSSKFMRNVIERPGTVWRAIVLGLRPAFLVNNLVGNHFLYAVSFAGYWGLRGLVESIRREKGDGFVKRLLQKDAPWHARPMFQALMEDFFPEQIHGTFGASQFPWTKNPKLAKFKELSLGVMPMTQAMAEGALRRAGVIAQLRRSPEVRARLRAMPRETRDFERAAREALEANPMLQKEIANKINRALGDYFNMSPIERHYIRSVFPFYAWYKAITMVTLRMPGSMPLRAELLANVGALGIEEVRERYGFLPSFLLGAVGLDPEDLDVIPMIEPETGRLPIINTAPLNPFATVSELAEAAGAALMGEPGEVGRQLLPLMNPFLQSAYEVASGRDVLTGQPVEGGPLGLLRIPVNVAESLPQSQIVESLFGEIPADKRKRKLYDQQAARLFLNFLGLPIRQVNPDTARFVKDIEEGRLRPIQIIVPNR